MGEPKARTVESGSDELRGLLGLSTSQSEGARMISRVVFIGFQLVFAVSFAAAADTPSARATLSAAQVAEKCVAARGGLDAWRAVQTMSMDGIMGAGGSQRATPSAAPIPAAPTMRRGARHVPRHPQEELQLQFAMDLERPRKSRFEISINGQKAVQVFDGTNGWIERPNLNGMDVEPYKPSEVKWASSFQTELDGPLVDYETKGTQIELDGMERVEDRDTYKLKLTTKDGKAMHLWVDAQTFIETKVEGQSRRLNGKEHPVEVYYRDYRQVDGLQIPFVLETRVLPLPNPPAGYKDNPVPTEKISIDKVEVNPKLDESLFVRLEAVKPQVDAAVAQP